MARLILSLLLTQLGGAMTAVGVVLLLLDRFGVSVESGLILAVQVLPNVLLGPLVGDLVSRYDPRRVAVIASLLSAGTVMLYPLAAVPLAASLVGLAVGAANLPGISSRMALRASVIPEPMQQRASGLIVAVERFGTVVGPLIATLIAALGHYTFIFFCEALFAAIAALLVLNLPKPAPAPRPDLQEGGRPHRRRFADWIGPYTRAWRLIREDRLVLNYTLSGVLYSISYGIQRLLFPALLIVTLHTSSDRVGILIAATAVGGIVGGVLAGRLRLGNRARWYVFITLGEVPLWLATPHAPDIVVLAALLAAVGVLEGSGTAIYFTEIQERVPSAEIGRYFSLMSPAVDVAVVVGVLTVSAIPTAAIPIAGTIIVAASAALPFMFLWRIMRAAFGAQTVASGARPGR